MKFSKIGEALAEKVNSVNVNNPRANSGAVLLKLSKTENFEDLIGIAFQIIQMSFTKDTTDSPAGTGKLTQISSLIGYKIGMEIGRGILPWRDQVRLGDIFIEAFKKQGYVDLYYPKIRDSSYIVSATSKWVELSDIPEVIIDINLIGSFEHKPSAGCPIKVSVMPEGIEEPYSHPIGVADNRYSKTVWWDAVTKLQRTPWRINTRVYEALIANKDMFISEAPIYDNDAKEQKRRSKMVEWGFITKKAAKLKGWDHFYQTMEADYRGRLYYCEPFLNFQGSDLARGMLKFARAKPMTEEGLWWLAVHTANSFNRSYDKDEIPEWCEADYRGHLEDEGLDSISVDKFTLEDRVRWTNEHMHTLVEAGRTSFLFEDAEKPVSLLACCLEWYDYSQADAENRIHMSHLPIPIDGSNNGWQHLGAISKDTRTGRLVGLIPQDIPKDFYVQTAKELLKIDDPKLNQMPMKHVRKGVTKRGSMTRAYSAGAAKIAENMWFDIKSNDFHIEYLEWNEKKSHALKSKAALKRLEEMIEKKDLDQYTGKIKTETDYACEIADEECLIICTYWAKELIKSIDIVCPGPLNTMQYLQNLAAYEIGEYKRFKNNVPANDEYKELQKTIKNLWDSEEKDLELINDLVVEAQTYESRLVYGNGKDRMKWTTPSGFPVTYTNFIMKSMKVRGTIDGKQIKHVAQLPTKTPDIRGFMCGISPNYIHSMDASHMAIILSEWTGDFGAVHDSFSTHACDVDKLLEITKRTFVEMYDTSNFYEYIEDQLISDTTKLDIEQPGLGSLDIKEVHESDYFFS